jgi:hypothetical protein
MNPAHDRGRICLHSALLHHLRQIAVGDPVLAVPSNTHQDDLNRKTPTLEHESSERLRTTLSWHQVIATVPIREVFPESSC